MNKTWYLFTFDQKAEDRVIRGGRRIGLELLCPHVTDWVKKGRDRKERPVSSPAFRNYLLVGCQGELPLAALMGLHRSIMPRLMTTPTQPALARVRLKDIQRVKNNRMFTRPKAREMLRETRPDPEYQLDEIVRILRGAATGFEGRILKIMQQSGGEVLQVELPGLFGKTEVEADYVQRAEAA